MGYKSKAGKEHVNNMEKMLNRFFYISSLYYTSSIFTNIKNLRV